MIHSRLLVYIDEVARQGSIRRAAERLNVASSAINRQILAYEQQLGRQIFERLPRGVRLTATGELVVEHIRATLKEHQRLLKRLQHLEGMRRTTINVAVLEALVTNVVAPVTASFHQKYPLAKVVVQSVAAGDVVPAVLSGEASLGVGFDLPREPNIQVLKSVPCSLGLVAGPDFPLSGRLSLRLADCVGYPFALPARTLTLRKMIDRALTEAKVPLHPMMETNSIDLLTLLWHFRFDGVCEKLLTMRTPHRWRPDEDLEDGLPDGWHARFRRRRAASFFRPAALRRRD